MYEFKGLVASVAGSSKAKNENAGFVTPRNKNVLSRKALFLDKPKMALGDLKKNSLNVVTPLKNGTIEKTKQQTPFQLLTPTFKSMKINDAAISTPTFDRINIKNAANSTPKSMRGVIDYTKDNVDVWNQKMVLSDHQFDLLFMNSPPPRAPPTPEPLPEREYPDYPPLNFDYESIWDKNRRIPQDDDYELPPLNIDFFGENFCGTPLKENDINAVNRIDIF